jgi:hypothetical protein
MASERTYSPKPIPDIDSVPFESAAETWFWFIKAQEAKNEGARITSGLSLAPRPCEPTDILKILDGLYRNRRLVRDHLLVLRHYGRRQMSPDARRIKEVRAHKLWKEALERMEPILVRKGIVRVKKLTCNRPNKFWAQGVVVHQGDVNTSNTHRALSFNAMKHTAHLNTVQQGASC